MRKIALLAAVVAVAMAFANVSSASALSWSQSQIKFETFTGMKITTSGGAANIECTRGFMYGKSSGAAVNMTTPLSGEQCNGGIGFLGSLTSQGQWSLTANSTSTATLKADTSPSGGTVMTFVWSGSGTPCTISVKGPITLPGLEFNNTAGTLKLNNSFPISSKSGWCAGLFGTTLNIQGTFSANGAKILP